MKSAESLASQLVSWFSAHERCIVAFSGGVDSTVVAYAANKALGHHSLAITAVSPSLSQVEHDDALQLAGQLGLNHRTISTAELLNPNYQQNDRRRCYFCKSELYGRLTEIAQLEGWSLIVSGTNADDLLDIRPGLEAAKEFDIRHPLAELSIGKNEVRQIASFWKLEVSAKPASPCLASRIAFGEAVTLDKLRMVEKAESLLCQMGYRELRVRWHAGGVARIEVPESEIASLLEPVRRTMLITTLKSLGFAFVTIDLEGFRSGSLHQTLSNTVEVHSIRFEKP